MHNIIIGVDTHKSNHIAVAINTQGARLGSTTIPTNQQGYCDLENWAAGFGKIMAFGIEGSGSYGAGLSRNLLAKGYVVLDVMRPNRQIRYLQGKSDSLDAEGAARSVLNGQATAQAKTQTGSSEMIRHLKIGKRSISQRFVAFTLTGKLCLVDACVDSSNIPRQERFNCSLILRRNGDRQLREDTAKIGIRLQAVGLGRLNQAVKIG